MDMQLEILLFFQSMRTDFLNIIFNLFSISAEVLIVLIVATLYWCIDKKAGQKILFCLCGSIALNAGIKVFVKAARPIGVEGLTSMRVETAGGYSFPSMHTQMSTTFWYSLAQSLKKKYVYVISMILIFGVGISRLYLAVHWPIDVLFGLIFGIMFAAILGIIFEYVDKNRNYMPMFIIFMIFLVYAIIMNGHEMWKMFGVYTGFLFGYIIENKYVDFDIEIKNKNNLSKFKVYSIYLERMILGLLSLGIVYLGLKLGISLILDMFRININIGIIDTIRYGLLVFCAVTVVPVFFKKFKLY